MCPYLSRCIYSTLPGPSVQLPLISETSQVSSGQGNSSHLHFFKHSLLVYLCDKTDVVIITLTGT